MRGDLPPAVREAVAALGPADGPQLIFDRGALAQNLRATAAAARRAELRVLFAVKSFPAPEVLALAAELLDGFDVASRGELDVARAWLRPHHLLSITDPTGAAARLPSARSADALAGVTPVLSCEDLAQLQRAAQAAPHARLAARLSSSLLGRDRAVGALQSGDGHHRSRFGVDVEPARATATLREMAAVARALRRPLGLHLHHSGVVPTSGQRFLDAARAALALAEGAVMTPAFLNLGGAWHGVADRLAEVWSELRAALPAGLELLVEPGRLFARGAGFAVGWVQAARSLDDRELRVLDLSRSCHLRWSQPELVAGAPRPGHGRKVTLVGPTCFEDDVLGDWQLDDAEPLAEGSAVVLRNITGYAVAWNGGFAGVPAATVRLVGADPERGSVSG
jgi:diaminopimelate decarboxylase